MVAELGPDETGAFLVWGDPSLYDSVIAVLEDVRTRGADFELAVVPGISSVSALAAQHRTTLNQVGGAVQITTGRRLARGWPADADDLVVMLDAQCAFLAYPDAEIRWGAYVSTPDEILIAGRVADVGETIKRERERPAPRRAGSWIPTFCAVPLRDDPPMRLIAVLAALLLTACAPVAEQPPPPEQTCTKATLPTRTPGKFTFATDEPVYQPWYLDNDPSNGKGFESAVAYALAEYLGYARADVVWTRVPFNAAIQPGEKSFDANLTEFSITEERRQAVDFSAPYYDVAQAAVTLGSSPAPPSPPSTACARSSSAPRSAPRRTPPRPR
ncbi:SAM-dependent methyltransferase [Actinokineospora soli]|uniref:SAM-dependent methyltransferase n=1 Tax=Actinokineospora soli TaxID=1048753 RepID=A0ABW2TLM8_9PSEU